MKSQGQGAGGEKKGSAVMLRLHTVSPFILLTPWCPQLCISANVALFYYPFAIRLRFHSGAVHLAPVCFPRPIIYLCMYFIKDFHGVVPVHMLVVVVVIAAVVMPAIPSRMLTKKLLINHI